MKPFSLIILSALLLNSCTTTTPDQIIVGWKPIYGTQEDVLKVTPMPPQLLKNLGKFYVKDNYLYVNELDKGIHVLDNTNPANPVEIVFISIPGNRDIAIKGDYLYADNYYDLVTIDIHNLNNIHEVSRSKNVYDIGTANLPADDQFGYFECVDRSKGIPVEWVQDSLLNPKCYK